VVDNFVENNGFPAGTLGCLGIPTHRLFFKKFYNSLILSNKKEFNRYQNLKSRIQNILILK